MNIPLELWLAGALLIGLLIEAFVKRDRPWAIPAIAVYLTVFGWYFVDPFQAPDDYAFIPKFILGFAYIQTGIFLIVFRLAVARMTASVQRRGLRAGPVLIAVSPQQLFVGLVCVWCVLLAYGVVRMHGDLVAALFPIDGRNGENMWARERVDSSGVGFIVSSCGYVYLLVCAFFGVTLVFLRQTALRLACAAMILLTWPFFLLQGSRNIFLGVSMPLIISYILFSRQRVAVKGLVLAASGVAMFFLLLAVVQHRNTGFRYLVDATAREQIDEGPDTDERGYQQEGLNMIQELCYCDVFIEAGVTKPEWGMRYLVEFTGVIPRALWPGKPELGADYAKWRGFGSLENSEDLYATISTGVIGGGVLNFGVWLGPLGPALLMAAWCALLSRWWAQRASVLRAGLFLAGMGLTFNLGRDITLLVLWPVVFGYALVRLVEFANPARGPARFAPPARPAAARLKPGALLPS